MNGFSDVQFLCRFLPCFLLVYYLAAPKLRPRILFFGSLVFYAMADLRFLPVLLAATVINLLLGRCCCRRKKAALLMILFLDAGLLVVFKTVGQLWGSDWMPVGISFYLFKMISYQVDVYRGRFETMPDLWEVGAYFVMFPQIMSGPIMRFPGAATEKSRALSPVLLWENSHSEGHFKERCLRIAPYLGDGLRFLMVGLGMKLLLADPLAALWNEITAIGYESISTPLAWLGVAVCSMNLYFDFWGYSLMAAGCGVMLGFPFVENFSHPYASVGIGDFYRRWHMTLGQWFRDYIYIPMGGSRGGSLRTIGNLCLVWILTGAWHGFSLHFMIWAGILLLVILWEKFVLKRSRVLMAVLGRLHVWLIVPLTWMIFTIADPEQLLAYSMRLFPFSQPGILVNGKDYLLRLENYGIFLVVGVICLFPPVFDFWKKHREGVVMNLLLLLLFGICLRVLMINGANPFLYLKF